MATQIVPTGGAWTADVKDWTWVIDRPCPECGYDPSSVERDLVGARVRALTAEWAMALGAGSGVARRTRPDRWSVLEYGCHVRDVFLRFDQRLVRMLTEDDPTFANWDQDRTAVEDGYDTQDPRIVAIQLHHAGSAAAAGWERVGGGDWDRTATRSDGARFDVDRFARYFLHDPTHHLWDIGRGAAQLVFTPR